MMLRLLALILILSSPALAQDEIIPYAEDDPAMEAAITEARATLPLFLDHALDAEGRSLDAAFVKVELPTVSGSPVEGEHIWVAPFQRISDEEFAGILANAPAHLGALQQGDRVDFTIDMISDWHLSAPSGLYWGSYTSRVMHASVAFGETPFSQIFEANRLPDAWR